MNVLFRGNLEQRARLVSGLTLFSFALTHFLNHGLGLYSVELMQSVEEVRLLVTRSAAGGIILGTALIVHILLALKKLALRSTLKMPFWEAAQLALGLSIPLLLFPHIVDMRFAFELFGKDTTYSQTLLAVWLGRDWQQSLLLAIVWVHACIGLNFWLRLSAGYKKISMFLFALAVAIPLAGLAGFMVSGRALEAKAALKTAEKAKSGYSESGYGSGGYGEEDNSGGYGEEDSSDYGYGGGDKSSASAVKASQAKTIAWLKDIFYYGFLSLLGLAGLVFLGRMAARRLQARVKVNYALGPTVNARAGPTLLEISRMNGVPHASVCGGRGRCSTCRVRIESGEETLLPPSAAESTTLAGIKAPKGVRLACQIRPAGALQVTRVLRPPSLDAIAEADSDGSAEGIERTLAVMFLDVRGFTHMSADKLPYDVVFILNRLFEATGQSIATHGGWIDKYLGDGLMAVFGRDTDIPTACRQALRAAREIDQALVEVNADLASEIATPLKIGMGIHVGPLVLGKIGYLDSSAMTVIGRTVNAAARLEALTKEMGCQLIISSQVAKSAALNLQDMTERRVEVRGIPDPLDVYCIPTAGDLPSQLN